MYCVVDNQSTLLETNWLLDYIIVKKEYEDYKKN